MTYRSDAYGRPIHPDLDALAREITSAMDANGGRLDLFSVGMDRYCWLEHLAAIFNGGSSVAAPIGQVNFIWRGVPVVPEEPASSRHT